MQQPYKFERVVMAVRSENLVNQLFLCPGKLIVPWVFFQFNFKVRRCRDVLRPKVMLPLRRHFRDQVMNFA